jgi:hypothetical protein
MRHTEAAVQGMITLCTILYQLLNVHALHCTGAHDEPLISGSSSSSSSTCDTSC